MDQNYSDYFDEDDLYDRLTEGLQSTDKEVIFIVGAPITASADGKAPGVVDVTGVTDLVRQQFSGQQQAKLDQILLKAANRYQQAFDFLKGKRSPEIAEVIIKRAVLNAHSSFDFSENEQNSVIPEDEVLLALEKEAVGWHLSPGVNALGRLLAGKHGKFGSRVITSNFDPLIEVAIRKFEGECWQTLLYTDGDLQSSKASGCQVIHIHGYWTGSDCLHTGRQLTQKRPMLKNSILETLKNKIVVVMAYGGWSDIFTDSLRDLVQNSAEFPEVIWTFFSDVPKDNEDVLALLKPGLDRNRVTLYRGINCHTFLPRILDYWNDETDSHLAQKRGIKEGNESNKLPALELPKPDSDRPPNYEVWVGRTEELDIIRNASSKVVSITGLGGQGKSALAAKYLSIVGDGETEFTHTDWRDCKEEGDRIRTQICSLIERLSREEISTAALADASPQDLIDILIDLSKKTSTVMVFDNVDHYVDFSEKKYLGILDELVRKFATRETNSKLIITCRPPIKYDLSCFESITITGLPLEDINQLYSARLGDADICRETIEKIWKYTDGHAFWNDLIAAQVARRPNTTLQSMWHDLQSGRTETPDILSTIWKYLPEREQLVLQVLSETVRPETVDTIQAMVSSKLNYNKFTKAMKSLTNANLIVVKPENNAPDLYDLHPLVRQFVRNNFGRSERSGFIQIVLNQYAVMIGTIGKMMGVYLPQSLLERYSQKAELEIEAGLIDEAFDTLFTSESAMMGSGNIEEYIRVSKILFSSFDWELRSAEIRRFDSVLSTFIECLCHHERYEEAEELLERFEKVVPQNTARFIGFCETACHAAWIRKDYSQAIEWGKRGVDLKNLSNVDTHYDCNNNLALAQRDGGDPETAIQVFLKQYNLDDLIAPEGKEALDDGPTLGNVGRCLQLMGRHEDALQCLKKSARAVEKDNGRTRATNRAWARLWIGESLEGLGASDLAYAFFMDGAEIIGSTSPQRESFLLKKAEKIHTEEDMSKLSHHDFERRVQAWIRSV